MSAPSVVPSLYRVEIGHARTEPIVNTFRYRSYMWLWDLDRPPRLPSLLRPLARFDPADHMDVRGRLAGHGLAAERIVVLCQARVFGYVFNPISVYWCYDGAGRLVAQVAEVHNTYGGRHTYVAPADQRHHDGTTEVSKEMYVSPFYPTRGTYRMHFEEPGPTLSVRVEMHRPGHLPFQAWMSGRRQKSLIAGLLADSVRYPVAPLRVRALIQLQGIRLWKRGLEVEPR